MAFDPDSLASSGKRKTYTSFATDIDLQAESGSPCRRIRINGAGSGALNCKLASSESADTITGLLQGDVLDEQATVIYSSGTSVTSVTVWW